MLAVSRRMRRWLQVLLPPSVSTSEKLRAAYATVELGPTALRISFQMALRSTTPAQGVAIHETVVGFIAMWCKVVDVGGLGLDSVGERDSFYLVR